MTAQILNGNRVARSRRVAIARRVEQRVASGAGRPGLAVILVGHDPASEVYVRNKRKDCEEVGFQSILLRLPDTVTQGELETHIQSFNERSDVHGILVQLPLPAHLHAQRLLELINPGKDVDGFHPYNLGRLAVRQPALRPCTSLGVMTLLAETRIPLRGLNATIVGASNHVGRPMGLELLLAGCTVTTAHKFTRSLQSHVEQADLLVCAVGKPGLVPGHWIKPGAIVIDVGLTRGEDGKLRGDVQFDTARERASWITPVPGGVGPMTRLAMLENTLSVALGEAADAIDCSS
ncbi:MAG: bifunctional methylenetetrahydrofolate dehydrogenase/methenyltetrahydrofolate cyclohydrolase FolD [Pseudomonadota bacterium]